MVLSCTVVAMRAFQFEILRISNHTACRFAEKKRFFRSLWAGRRCAAASRFTFFKAKTLYTESGDGQADGRYAARISAGLLRAQLHRMPPGNAFHAAYAGSVRRFLKIVVVYFAGERKGGTRCFSEQTLCVFSHTVCRLRKKRGFSLSSGRAALFYRYVICLFQKKSSENKKTSVETEVFEKWCARRDSNSWPTGS